MRYEYVLQFRKAKNTRLVPALGFGYSGYYERQSYNPKTTIGFPVINTELGVRLFVVPRLNYFFSKKFYLDLNVPLCLSDISLQLYNIKDPALSVSAQKYGLVNFELFPKLMSMRLGVGMKI